MFKAIPKKEIMIGSCFVCFGIFGALSIAHDVILSSRAIGWPRVVGKLISANLKQCKGNNQASLVLLYDFEVDQNTFSGTRYSFIDQPCMDRNIANEIRHVLGEPKGLVVAYNPKNPAQSTVESGVNDIHWMSGFIVSLVAIMLGIMTLFFTADSSGKIHRRIANRDD